MGNLWSNILLGFIGISAGVIISGGLFAFISMVGVVTRLISRTRTAKSVMFYEDLVILGASLGNLLSLFEINVPIGMPGLILFGTFSGVFIGCLAVALAETIQAIPVFAHRTKLKMGLSMIVLSMALGKCLGSLFQLYYMWGS